MPLKELAERRNLLHRKSDPQTVLKHALDDPLIGPVALVSSFGAESVVLLHMVAQIAPKTPVIFLDTEMLFAETLSYQQELAAFLGLDDIRVIRPDRAELLAEDVDGILHRYDQDACCSLRKVRPLTQALDGFGGWITGRKRAHGATRSALPLFERQDGRIKVNPLAEWGLRELNDYISHHALPRHPLVAQGFTSLGCMPCTTATRPGEDPRAGRWRGQDKTECGIHFAEDGTVIRKQIGDAA